MSGFVSPTNQRAAFNTLTNDRTQAEPASPRPSTKSKALSQSPASSASALLSGLPAPLVSDMAGASARPSQPNFATAAAAATQNGESENKAKKYFYLSTNTWPLVFSGKLSGESVKVEGLSSPPASPAHSLSSLFPGPGQSTAELGLTDSPASMASLASGIAAAGSYPHLASGPGLSQTNGGHEVNMQEHLQQQQVKSVLMSDRSNNPPHLFSCYQNLCPH